MSLNDKILEIYKKWGSLSTEDVRRILKEHYGIEKSLRTVQRHVVEQLVNKKGILASDKPRGREQTYSLVERGRANRTTVKQPIILTFLMVAIISIFGFITLQKLGNVALQSISNQTGLEAERIMVQVSPYLILSPAVVFAFALLFKAKRLIQSKLKLF